MSGRRGRSEPASSFCAPHGRRQEASVERRHGIQTNRLPVLSPSLSPSFSPARPPDADGRACDRRRERDEKSPSSIQKSRNPEFYGYGAYAHIWVRNCCFPLFFLPGRALNLRMLISFFSRSSSRGESGRPRSRRRGMIDDAPCGSGWTNGGGRSVSMPSVGPDPASASGPSECAIGIGQVPESEAALASVGGCTALTTVCQRKTARAPHPPALSQAFNFRAGSEKASSLGMPTHIHRRRCDLSLL